MPSRAWYARSVSNPSMGPPVGPGGPSLGKQSVSAVLGKYERFCGEIGKTKRRGRQMDANHNGAREASIAAYTFSFLFIVVLGLSAVAEIHHPPGNPHVTMAALSTE